jgi:hypothetical protein
LLRMEPRTMARSDTHNQDVPGYRSPWRVLARFFEKSRDLWKAKYQALQERIKEYRTEVRDLPWNRRSESCEPKCSTQPSSPPPRRGSRRMAS